MFRAITARGPVMRAIVCAKTFKYRAGNAVIVEIRAEGSAAYYKACEKAGMMGACEEDGSGLRDSPKATDLRTEDKELWKLYRPATSACFEEHRKKFVQYCIWLFIDGTNQLRCPGISFSDWVETLSMSNKVVNVPVGEQDCFGAREIVTPISAFRAMQNAYRNKGSLSTRVLERSCPRHMAIAIKYIDDQEKDALVLTQSHHYLLFKLAFGISVEECIESSLSRWDLQFKTPRQCREEPTSS